jgi:hypothetical protein
MDGYLPSHHRTFPPSDFQDYFGNGLASQGEASATFGLGVSRGNHLRQLEFLGPSPPLAFLAQWIFQAPGSFFLTSWASMPPPVIFDPFPEGTTSGAGVEMI